MKKPRTRESRPPAGPQVGIVMGSDSDADVMFDAARALDEFGVTYEMEVCSAHRTPQRAQRYALEARERGLKVIIAGAGGAAHLAGVMAAGTTLPVIAVPLAATPLGGLDALLSSVQMPAGVPVGTVAIGKMGARNAGLLAVQILAVHDAALAAALARARTAMVASVAEKNRRLQARLPQLRRGE